MQDILLGRITFRPPTHLDYSQLWNWRNDDETRRNSFNTDVIPIETHMKWIDSIMKEIPRNKILLIAEHEEKRIGTVRMDLNFETLTQELSWTIAPFFRRQGYGRRMIQGLLNPSYKWINAEGMFCKIRSFNQASIKIALAAGFKLVGVEGDDTLIFKH